MSATDSPLDSKCVKCHASVVHPAFKTECLHIYCGPCLTGHLSYSKTCASCDRDLSAFTLVDSPCNHAAIDVSSVPMSPPDSCIQESQTWFENLKKRPLEYLNTDEDMDAAAVEEFGKPLMAFFLSYREKIQKELDSVLSISKLLDGDIDCLRLLIDKERPAKRLAQSDSKGLRMEKLESMKLDIEDMYDRRRGEGSLLDFGRRLLRLTGENCLQTKATISMASSDLHNNIISSLEFNNNGKLFAAAGVSKRIGIFDYDAMQASDWTDIFPAAEYKTFSKLSCVAWSPGDGNKFATTDYEGSLHLYDVTRGEIISRFEEHDRRAWSVHYSPVDPSRLVTGSDDHLIKIWSTTSRYSVCTVNAKSNVCSVQFSPACSNTIAFGSSDNVVHVYDLRNASKSTHVLVGHKRAVSYVRFKSATELVTASIDATVRLWDLDEARIHSGGINAVDQSISYTSHVNKRNFVGLALNEDIIAAGSESNTVYLYNCDFGKPIATHCLTEGEVVAEEQDSPFTSALAWRPNSDCLLAANSLGTIKVLQHTF